MRKTLLACLASLGLVGSICAQSTEELIKAQERDSAAPGQGVWWEWNTATDDWLGSRTSLEEKGLEIFGGYTSELWGNTTGGLKQGTVYTGLLDFGANLDLEKLVGWQGASVSSTWLWLSGRDASEDLTGNFLTISNIAGFNTLRMLELWFQQNLLEDKISLRLGQLTADSEFVISDYAGTFINGTFGWPAFIYTNLPAGGPGYPMGTLGIRLAITPVDWLTFQSAVFQGNVYEQNVNRHGFRWRLDGENGFLFFNEAHVRWNHRDDSTGLPGQAKAGTWIQTGQSADVLAESTNSGNYGWYFILDQMLYRELSVESAAPLGAPAGGKSTLDAKESKSFKPPVALEKSDQGLGWFGLGNTAQNALIEEGSIGVGAEMVLELTYQCQVTPWLVVQPDLQYIINPGGTQDFGDALVIGGRVSIIF